MILFNDNYTLVRGDIKPNRQILIYSTFVLNGSIYFHHKYIKFTVYLLSFFFQTTFPNHFSDIDVAVAVAVAINPVNLLFRCDDNNLERSRAGISLQYRSHIF